MINPNANSGKHCPNCGAELSVIGFKMGSCKECQEIFNPDEIGKGKRVTENKNTTTMGTETLTNVTKHVKLGDITLSDTNPRKHMDQDRLEELAESIGKHGVIQPVTIRPIEDGETAFEMVSGERRYRASQMAGQEKIPAYIREMDDEEAFEIQCIENLQREDVHPLDEAAGYQTMVDQRGMNPVEIAERMDRSVSYVTKRMKMNDLIDPLAEQFYQDGEFKIGHAMELARLTGDHQNQLYEEYFSDPEAFRYMPTVSELRSTIGREFMLSLEDVRFDTEDPELYPEAGPCTTCPKRSSNNPSLFPELEGEDRCTDKACFSAKRRLNIVRLIDEHKDDPNMYFLQDYRDPEEVILEKLEQEDITLLKKYDDFREISDETVVRGVYVGGNDAGKIVSIKLQVSGTKEEREEQLPRKDFLNMEIQRIEERKARKVELDREKVNKRLIAELPEYDYLGQVNQTSKRLHQLALAWVLYDGLSWGQQKDYQVDLGVLTVAEREAHDFVSGIDVMKAFDELSHDGLEIKVHGLLAAWVMTNCTSKSQLDPEKTAEAFLLREFGKNLIPDIVQEAKDEQADKRKKREARYKKQLSEYREEIGEEE